MAVFQRFGQDVYRDLLPFNPQGWEKRAWISMPAFNEHLAFDLENQRLAIKRPVGEAREAVESFGWRKDVSAFHYSVEKPHDNGTDSSMIMVTMGADSINVRYIPSYEKYVDTDGEGVFKKSSGSRTV